MNEMLALPIASGVWELLPTGLIYHTKRCLLASLPATGLGVSRSFAFCAAGRLRHMVCSHSQFRCPESETSRSFLGVALAEQLYRIDLVA